jgi:hypothetical protein
VIQGLKGPLQRGANDFIVLKGKNYFNNRIEVFFGIYSNPFDGTGELEWDQEAGVLTELLRHRNVTKGRLEIATLYLVEQLRKWEPDLVFTKVAYTQKPGSEVTNLAVSWAHKRLGISGTAETEIER